MAALKFRKKPVVIEAVQYTGHNAAEIQKFTDGVALREASSDDLFIRTLEGAMKAGIGDWIIRGVSGEFYPCKPGIFARTYEAA